MEPRYLLDTNICIYIRQKRPDEVLRRFQKLRLGEAVLSVITYGEFCMGQRRASNVVRHWSDCVSLSTCRRPHFPCRNQPPEPTRGFAQGQMIGNNDLWIAAHAVSARLTLVTNNEKEFRRVAGLKIQNWPV
jgi:tRNA(fMet)-specific endonuclease VapC